jgi:hypothetical protein
VFHRPNRDDRLQGLIKRSIDVCANAGGLAKPKIIEAIANIAKNQVAIADLTTEPGFMIFVTIILLNFAPNNLNIW